MCGEKYRVRASERESDWERTTETDRKKAFILLGPQRTGSEICKFDVQVFLPSGDARDHHERADSKKFTQSVVTLVLPIKRFKNERNESCCPLSEYEVSPDDATNLKLCGCMC